MASLPYPNTQPIGMGYFGYEESMTCGSLYPVPKRTLGILGTIVPST